MGSIGLSLTWGLTVIQRRKLTSAIGIFSKLFKNTYIEKSDKDTPVFLFKDSWDKVGFSRIKKKLVFIACGMMSSAILRHSVIALNNDLGWLIRTPRYGWGLYVQLCLASFCHSLKWPWPPGQTQSLSKIHRNTHMQLKMYVDILVHSIIRLILIIAHISWMHSNLNTPTSMQTHTHAGLFWMFL